MPPRGCRSGPCAPNRRVDVPVPEDAARPATVRRSASAQGRRRRRHELWHLPSEPDASQRLRVFVLAVDAAEVLHRSKEADGRRPAISLGSLPDRHARPRRVRAGSFLQRSWSVVVDIVCVSMIVWIASGLYMWWELPGQRRWGWLAIARAARHPSLFFTLAVVKPVSPGSGDTPRVAFGACGLSTKSTRDDDESVRGAACGVRRRHYSRRHRRRVLSATPAKPATTSASSRARIASWHGDRSRLRVATKGGLTRPNGLWVPDGRAQAPGRGMRSQPPRARRRSDHLYQLACSRPTHATRDQHASARGAQARRAIETSVSVTSTVGQIEEARQIDDIAAVQVELSPWKDENVLNGVAAYCMLHRIPLLAHRPFGGPQRRRRVVA